jgi:uncharacterized membrane protein YcaP (DUF421 family)
MMWQLVMDYFTVALGFREPGPRSLTPGEMAGRAAVGFLLLLGMVRIGRRRLMSRIGPFDLIVTMIVGSTLSRGITGNASFAGTLAACAAVILTHWAVAACACRWAWFGRWVEGRPVALVVGGRPLHARMRRHVISEQDLLESLRLEGRQTELSKIKVATLERSGNISVVLETSSQGDGTSDAKRQDEKAGGSHTAHR